MRILIVEDDLISQKILQKNLKKKGYDIVSAGNGIEAWEIYQSETIKMVITDWMMPKMDGLTLCRNIRNLYKDYYTYIIFLTAKDRQEDLVKVFEAGADDYIIKPFDNEELRARIATGERIIRLEEAHKNLADVLRASRNKFKAVFDSLQEEIVSIDSENRIVSMNRAFIKNKKEEVLSQAVGKNLFSEVGLDPYPENNLRVEKSVKKVFGGSESLFLDYVSGRQGEPIFKEVTCLPILDETGDIVQVAIVSRDVTEEKKRTEQIRILNKKLHKAIDAIKTKNQTLEETLQQLKDTQAQMLQSEKMSSIGQLAAGIAHEINNPTGFVSSNLKTLSNYYQDMEDLVSDYRTLVKDIGGEKSTLTIPEPILKQSEHIVRKEKEIDLDYVMGDIKAIISECSEGMGRIKQIVLDLKDFAHPGEDKVLEADVNQGLDSTLNVVWNEIKYKATVSKDYQKLPLVKCYPQLLNQVFMNILVNAAQAIEKYGEIKISTRTDDGHLVIQISDNGVGIPGDHIPRIFDPFFTTKEVGKGTGLGMNVAYNIVQRHKGSIHVLSEVGRGTTFTIKIPTTGLED